MTSPISLQGLTGNWPYHISKFKGGPRDQQSEIFRFVVGHNSSLIEGPTGLGKGAVEYVIAKACASKLGGPIFWIVPTKALVKQFAEEFPDVTVALGRGDHPCIYAAEDFDPETKHPVTAQQLVQLTTDPQAVKANDVATMVCRKCPHYVDTNTGKTNGPGALRCPVYQQKYEVSQADVVLCTMSFYLFAHLFSRKAGKQKNVPDALVIDEVHRLPKVVRYSLSYDITDYHLTQSIELLERLNESTADEVRILKKFRRAITHIAQARDRKAKVEVMLEDDEIRRLIGILDPIDTDELESKISGAVSSGTIDRRKDRVAIKRLETLVRDIRRYVHSFMYSLEEHDEEGEVTRRPLNYTCSYYRTEKEVVEMAEETGDKRYRKKVTHKLIIHCSYVAPLIRKRLLAPFTVGLSATIGDKDVFGFISGIKFPLLRLESDFPTENRRIYVPNDTPSLAFDAPGSKRQKANMLRQIAQTCKWLSRRKYRSLVVTVSEEERANFLRLAEREGLNVMTYGNGVAAKDAASQFRDGEGVVLLGTSAHYSEGIDLPDEMAPVIFFLRPGYPNPRSPEQQFMVKRFGKSTAMMVNQYDVMQQVNQTAGRNVRSSTDRGSIICVDARFKRIAFAALAKWLEPAYRGSFEWDQCLDDTVKLLKS